MPCPSSEKPLLGLVSDREKRRWCGKLLAGWLMMAILFGAGCKRREIARPTPQMHAESRFWIRVLLIAECTECTISSLSPIHVNQDNLNSDVQDNTPSIASFDGSLKASVNAGRLMLGNTSVPDGQVLLTGDEPHILTLNDRPYRGNLRISVNDDGRTLRVINLVPLEPYLAGVVGAEMPSYWEPEALKAQAIAARTYCLYTKNRFGRGRDWDVKSSEASQVYRGTEAETAQIWNAVTSTYGHVLVVEEPDSTEQGLFPAYYSAVCGGYTEDCKSVFGETFEPLQQVACPYCKDVAKLGLFFWPMAQFDSTTITEQLTVRYPSIKALGEIRQIDVIEESHHGQFSRLTRVRLIGSTGKADSLRAEDLRLSLDPTGRKIQSTMCNIVPWGNGWAFLSGRGWGHGVGMCQCGAEGMARQGKTTEEILEHYYPGSKIVSIY